MSLSPHTLLTHTRPQYFQTDQTRPHLTVGSCPSSPCRRLSSGLLRGYALPQPRSRAVTSGADGPTPFPEPSPYELDTVQILLIPFGSHSTLLACQEEERFLFGSVDLPEPEVLLDRPETVLPSWPGCLGSDRDWSPKVCQVMVPDSAQSPGSEGSKNPATEDMVLAGYRECATEAMQWLSALGYEPGHPLMRSLAAHLTKKQAYLEKINLECYLVDQSLKNEEGSDCDSDEDEDGAFRRRLRQVQNSAEMQRALVEAVFRGCDLRYQ